MSDAPQFRLISQYDDKIINVTGAIIVGRQKTCNIVLPYDSISREHARLSVVDNILLLEDLGSSNGTFVNSEKISKAELASGDIVAFDQYQFQVEIIGIPQAVPQESEPHKVKQEEESPAPKADVQQPVKEAEAAEQTPVEEKKPFEQKSIPETPVTASVQNQESTQNKVPDKSPEPQPEKPEQKAEQKPEPKPEAKSEPKPETTPQKKPQADTRTKPAEGANWWEKGNAGPKSTMFMDALDPSMQNVAQDEIPKTTFDEPVLYGVSDPIKGNVIKLLQGSKMLGRSDTCDYKIDSKHISDKHAQLIYEPPTLKVIGMPNTTNGTFVNGEKAGGSVYLKTGDILSFGPIQFKVLMGATTTKQKPIPKDQISKGSGSRYTLIAAIVIAVAAIGIWYLLKI